MNDEAVYRTAPATPGLLKNPLGKVMTGHFSQNLRLFLFRNGWRLVVMQVCGYIVIFQYFVPYKNG